MENGAIGIAAWRGDIIVGAISIKSKEIEFGIDTREEDVTGLGGEALYLVGVHGLFRYAQGLNPWLGSGRPYRALEDYDFIAFVDVRHDLFS